MEWVAALIALVFSVLLVALYAGRYQWGWIPFAVMLAAVGYVAQLGVLFGDIKLISLFLVFTVQVALLILLVLQPKVWREGLVGVFVASGLSLVLQWLLRALDLGINEQIRDGLNASLQLFGQAVAVVLGAWWSRWLYERMGSSVGWPWLLLCLSGFAVINVGLVGLWIGSSVQTILVSFVVMSLLVLPVLLVFFEYSQRRLQTYSSDNSYNTLQSTVEALAKGSESELWPRLVRSLVEVVPGAKAGSIRLREGNQFRFVAEQGFSQAIIGILSRETEAIQWYGDESDWHKGEPRIANSAQLNRLFEANKPNLELSEQLDQAASAGLKTSNIRSNLCLPIVLGGEVVAEINLDAFEDGAFNQESIAICRQYALQVTALVASLRERAKLEARVREFEVIETLSLALRNLNSAEEITGRIVAETTRLMDSPDAGLVLLESNGETLRWVAAVGDFEQLTTHQVPKGKGFVWSAMESLTPIWSNQAHIDRRGFSHASSEPYSQITMPMLNSAGQAVGVLLSARAGANGYTEQDVRVLQVIANIATNTLERVRNNQGLLEKLREFEVIEEVSRALSEAKSIEKVADALTVETQRLMRSQIVGFYKVSSNRVSLELVARCGDFHPPQHIPKGSGLSWAAIEAHQPLLTPNVSLDPRAFFVGHNRPSTAQITQPIFDSKGETLGVLVCTSWQPNDYGEAELRLIQLVTSVAASALERVQASVELENEVQEKRFLLELSQMLEGNSKDQIVEALAYVRGKLGADVAVLSFAQGDKVSAYLVEGNFNAALQERWEKGWSATDVTKFYSFLLEQKQMVADPMQPYFERMERMGVKALLGVPLGKEIAFGGLLLYRFNQVGGWSQQSVELAKGCGHILGAVVSRVEGLKRLEEAHEGALRLIGVALEARDRETAGHTDRVARSAQQIGSAANLSPTDLRDLRWGAYLHDIGKLAIPDSILLKPGKLTPEEFSTMKTHSALGHDLIRSLPFVPETARQVVRHHHERMDGRGYPDSLAGEDIPLPARIFAICDVFDALCSERPYKSAMSAEDAARELWRSAQTGHLDQRLVKVFLELRGLAEAVLVSQAAD